ITRLQNLGLEPFKIAESLSAVLAQRLLRTLCPGCRRLTPDTGEPSIGNAPPRMKASAGPGCDRCKHAGYLGRVPVAEVLTPADGLRDAIARGATAHEIRSAMRSAGL